MQSGNPSDFDTDTVRISTSSSDLGKTRTLGPRPSDTIEVQPHVADQHLQSILCKADWLRHYRHNDTWQRTCDYVRHLWRQTPPMNRSLHKEEGDDSFSNSWNLYSWHTFTCARIHSTADTFLRREHRVTGLLLVQV